MTTSSSPATNPVLVEAWRGAAVESMHRGALALVDADGGRVCAVGDIDRPVFPRSAIKLLQALPLVASGAADALGLSDVELALACASHGGEAMHVDAAASMLAKAGLDAGALECGAHWPLHEGAARALAAAGGTPGALHNNCSGKHAGMLCLACLRAGGADPRGHARGYVQADHPVMREVAGAIGAATGCDLRHAPRATDGCSVPTWALPLRALALGFARLAAGTGIDADLARAGARLRRAVAREPLMAAGSGRFDSLVAARLGERVYCKVGAEGVYCAALPQLGLGLAIKIDDGATRAGEVALAAAIGALLPLQGDDAAFVHGRAELTLRNWNGIEVGRLAAAEALRRALPAHPPG